MDMTAPQKNKAVLIAGLGAFLAVNAWADVVSQLDQAKALRAKGAYEQSIPFYQQALVKDPDNADVLIEFAQTAAWAGHYDKALEIYDQVLRLHPNHADAYIGKAFVLSWQKKFDEAEKNFETVIALSPDYEDAYLGLARLYAWKGNFKDAAALLDTFTKKENHKNDISLILTLARAQRDGGETKEAIVNYRRALAVDPSRQDIHAELGQALAQAQKLDDAITELEKAIAVKSANVDDFVSLGRVYSYKNRLDDSKRLYKEALAKDPNNLDALNGLARTHGYAHEWENSRKIFMDVLKKNPSNIEARDGIERLNRAKGPEFDARYNFFRSETNDPESAPQIESLDYGPDAEWTIRTDPDTAFFVRTGRFVSLENNLDRNITRIRTDRTELGLGSRLFLPGKIRFVGRADWIQFKDNGANQVTRDGKVSVGAGFAVLEREWGRQLWSASLSQDAFVRKLAGTNTWDPSLINAYAVADDISWTDEISTLLQGGQDFYPYLSSSQADTLGRIRYRPTKLPAVLEFQARYRSEPDHWNYTGFLTVKTEIFKPWLRMEIKTSLDRDTYVGTTGYGLGGLLTWKLSPRFSLYQTAAYRRDFGFKGNSLFGSAHVGYDF